MTANPMRGEAMLGEHKLVVDFNGWCSLERELGRTVPELIAMMKSGFGFGYHELRAFVRHFCHPPLTDQQAGDLIASLGMVEVEVEQVKGGKKKEKQTTWVAAVALSQAVEGFFAPREESDARPLKAA